MRFDDFPFHEKILAGIRDIGFSEPTPVQSQTFDLIFKGKDIEAQSQTGTGKTAAFLISGFHLLLTDPQFQGRKMLVIAPTRELADQIEKEAQLIGKYLGLRIGAFYGGVGYNQQEKLLADGVDVMIGTPGRLLDFAGSGKVSFHDVGVLVIDEADRLFDMGFYPDLRQMLRTMSNPEDRRTMLFSATLSSQVMNLAWEYLKDPGQIVIEPENVTVERIQQTLYHVASEEKFGVLLSLLSEYREKTAIVFTNTKHTAIRVAKRLEMNGFPVEFIMGDLPQSKRLKIIEDLKSGKLPFLVATDVAARGLHINDLDLVVNYDLPLEAENYVHRIGRTARAGKEGRAVSLACEKYVYGLKAIEEYISAKIPVAWFDEASLVPDKSRGVSIHIDEDDFQGRRPAGRARSNDRNSSRSPQGSRSEGSGRFPGRSAEARQDNKPIVIRSSPLVNEATGSGAVKSSAGVSKNSSRNPDSPRRAPRQGEKLPSAKDPRKNREEPRKPFSAQGERIAAAAAAVGASRGKRGRPGPKPAVPVQKASAQPARATSAKESRPRAERPSREGSRSDHSRTKSPAAIKDRLDYYKSKYGEDFKAVHVESEPKKKLGLLDRLAGIFGKKKKTGE
jgi:ATP-dependent RNA helicase RhlB